MKIDAQRILSQPLGDLLARLQSLIEWIGSDSDRKAVVLALVDEIAKVEASGLWREDYMKVLDAFLMRLDPGAFTASSDQKIISDEKQKAVAIPKRDIQKSKFTPDECVKATDWRVVQMPLAQ